MKRIMSIMNIFGRCVGLFVFSVIVFLTLLVTRHLDDFFFEMKRVTNDVLVLEKITKTQKIINIVIALSAIFCISKVILILF